MSERIKKLNDLLRDEVGQIITHELDKDDGALITVIGADVSPTLENATIRISVFPDDKALVSLKKLKEEYGKVVEEIRFGKGEQTSLIVRMRGKNE